MKDCRSWRGPARQNLGTKLGRRILTVLRPPHNPLPLCNPGSDFRKVPGCIDHLGNPPVSPPALSQSEAVHNAAHMVRIVTYAEASLDRLGETHGGPAVGFEPCGP